jgi:hypothetical protein
VRHAAYREDIDGLRALAVLSVIGFHFEAPRVFGGFVAGTAAASENTNRSTDLVLSSAHDLSRHVFDHAPAQRADGLLAHWELLS